MPTAVEPKSKGSRTIFWWVVWISLTIGSFFIASAFWTPVIARHFGSIQNTKTAAIWVAAVFGTWMVFLIPLIIVMYYKVDKTYEDARMRREKAFLRYRAVFVEKSKRKLPEKLAQKVRILPEAIEGGRLVTLILKTGAKVPYVFVAGEDEILGIYDYTEFSIKMEDIVDLEPTDLTRLPSFLPMNWLRLDGVQLPD